MRMMPFYSRIKENLNSKRINYYVTGSQFGLITNAIHYIDHMAYLTECNDFTVDIGFLDTKSIESKRKGFLELNGTLNVRFSNGSFGSITCFPSGSVPIQVEIYSDYFRCISNENEQKAWVSSPNDNWKWHEIEAHIPYQSQMTTQLIDSILSDGNCLLSAFEISSKLHIQLMEPLLKLLNYRSGEKYNYYPFT
jgi:hypothetical protein